MIFHKNMSMEKQEYLTKELKDYEMCTQMSAEERRELHTWVAAGNSVHDNPDYISGEDGWPMAFVEAFRADIALCEEMASLSLEELEELYHQQDLDRDSPPKSDNLAELSFG